MSAISGVKPWPSTGVSVKGTYILDDLGHGKGGLLGVEYSDGQ